MKCVTFNATAIGVLSWTPATDIEILAVASATGDLVLSHDPTLTNAILKATQQRKDDVIYYKTAAAASFHPGEMKIPVEGGKPIYLAFGAAGVAQIYYDELNVSAE